MRKAAVALAPVLICATMPAVFSLLSNVFGATRGYLFGFIIYWIGWCGILPLWALGSRGFARVFAGSVRPLGRPTWVGIAAVCLPLVLGYGYAFPRAIATATMPAIAISAALAVINATAEELLWRAMFIDVFGESILLGWVYPSVGFAIWHLAPLSIFPNNAPGGSASFVLTAGVVGLLWGWLARRTQSIRWTTISHILFDFPDSAAVAMLEGR